MNNSTNNIHNSGNPNNNNNNSSSGNNTSDNSNNTGVGGFSFGFNAGRSSIPPASRVGNGRDSAKTGFAGIEGMLGGLSELFKTLTDLAEKGQEMKNSGEFSTGQAGQGGGQGKQGKDVKFQYGFSVKTMNNGQDVKVEPFGNFKRDENTGDAVVHEVREPMADVMDEADGTVIVLEMPGIAAGDVKLIAAGDVLTITADRGSKRYRKELLLPATFDTAKMAVTCNNGVVEIRCGK